MPLGWALMAHEQQNRVLPCYHEYDSYIFSFIVHCLEITYWNNFKNGPYKIIKTMDLISLQVALACCSLCGSVFDEWQHKPKILSCGHTFCYNCLICVAQDVEVKCPSGCPFITTLTEAGISGESLEFLVYIVHMLFISVHYNCRSYCLLVIM